MSSSGKVPVTRTFQKILLVFISLVLAELSLRAGGAFLNYMERRGNVVNLSDAREVRILCLGESTTGFGFDQSYPRQLERILRAEVKGKKIRVINEGMAGKNTSNIVSLLPGFLSKYHPQIVTFMMGINDTPGEGRSETGTGFFANLRLVRFARLIGVNLKYWWLRRRTATRPVHVSNLDPKQVSFKQLDRDANFEERWQNFAAATRLYEEAIGISKRPPPRIYFDLGVNLMEQGRYDEADRFFEKYVKVSPDPNRYCLVGRVYRHRWGSIPQAVKMALKYAIQAVHLDPSGAHSASLWMLIAVTDSMPSQTRTLQRALERAVNLRTKYPDAYTELASIDLDENRLATALTVLRQGERVCGKKQKLVQMLADFESADKKSPRDPRKVLWRYSRTVQNTAPETGDIWRAHEPAFMNSRITRQNMLKAVETVKQSGALPVLIQYPRLDIQPIKRLFADQRGIIFVENVDDFRKAFRKYRFDDLFSDHFDGIFGHFTPLGSHIVAEQIAKAFLTHGVFEKPLSGTP